MIENVNKISYKTVYILRQHNFDFLNQQPPIWLDNTLITKIFRQKIMRKFQEEK